MHYDDNENIVPHNDHTLENFDTYLFLIYKYVRQRSNSAGSTHI